LLNGGISPKNSQEFIDTSTSGGYLQYGGRPPIVVFAIRERNSIADDPFGMKLNQKKDGDECRVCTAFVGSRIK